MSEQQLPPEALPDIPMKAPDEEPGFFQKPKNIKAIIIGLFVVCGLLILLDVVNYKDHIYFSQERWFGFYGFYGFVGCVSLVLAAKVLRKIVMRKEDYYDE